MFGDILERWSACAGLDVAEACHLQWNDAGAMVGLALVGGITILLILKLGRALLTIRAKSFTPGFSRLLSSWVKTNDYTGPAFFRADGADEPTVARRQQAIDRLADSAKSLKRTGQQCCTLDEFAASDEQDRLQARPIARPVRYALPGRSFDQR